MSRSIGGVDRSDLYPEQEPARINHLPRLYFLHISKTAGTSFRTWLSRYFSPQDLLAADHLPELETATDDVLRQHRLFSGHFGWRMMERAANLALDIEPVTVLREPAAVYVSLANSTDNVGPEIDAKLGGGEAHFKRLRHNQETGRASDVPKPFWNMGVNFIAASGWQVADPPIVNEGMLALAENRLAGMRFFGIAEDWPRSAVLFADAFKLPFRPMVERWNTRKATSASVPPASKNQTSCPYLSYDDKLYKFGTELFDVRWREMAGRHGVSCDAEIEAFRAPLLRQFLQQDLETSLLRGPGRIPVSAGIITDGFQARYATPDGGWRLWAGPELESHLYLPLDRSHDVAVSIAFELFMSPEIAEKLTVRVDGVASDHIKTRVKSGDIFVTIVEFRIPRRSGPRRYTDVGFEVPAAIAVSAPAFRGAVTFAIGGDIMIE